MEMPHQQRMLARHVARVYHAAVPASISAAVGKSAAVIVTSSASVTKPSEVGAIFSWNSRIAPDMRAMSMAFRT